MRRGILPFCCLHRAPVRFRLSNLTPEGQAALPNISILATAFNDDEFETFDSILIDLIIPSDGTYFVKVDRSPFAPGAIGTYELFINRFNGVAVPEPGSVEFLVLGMTGLGLNRRRRRCSQ